MTGSSVRYPGLDERVERLLTAGTTSARASQPRTMLARLCGVAGRRRSGDERHSRIDRCDLAVTG